MPTESLKFYTRMSNNATLGGRITIRQGFATKTFERGGGTYNAPKNNVFLPFSYLTVRLELTLTYNRIRLAIHFLC